MQAALLAIGLTFGLGFVAQQDPSLGSIIEQVSRNVQEFHHSLPDYVCRAHLVKNSGLRLAPGMPRSQTTESMLTARRFSRGGETNFFGSRQILVSGLDNGMVDLWSTLGDDVAVVFAPQNLRATTTLLRVDRPFDVSLRL